MHIVYRWMMDICTVGEAYWTQMMCTDAEWMPVVRKWATEQLNVNERTDVESK